jgi:hypothetical protein
MGLKSKEWFYKQCLLEVDAKRPLAKLAWSALMKGVAQQDYTRGHVGQAIGSVQMFFTEFPQYRKRISQTSAVPYDIVADSQMRDDWTDWLERMVNKYRARQGAYGRTDFKFNFNTMKTYLPPSLGGKVRQTPGGVGLDEFKMVLRLTAEFWDRA